MSEEIIKTTATHIVEEGAGGIIQHNYSFYTRKKCITKYIF